MKAKWLFALVALTLLVLGVKGYLGSKADEAGSATERQNVPVEASSLIYAPESSGAVTIRSGDGQSLRIPDSDFVLQNPTPSVTTEIEERVVATGVQVRMYAYDGRLILEEHYTSPAYFTVDNETAFNPDVIMYVDDFFAFDVAGVTYKLLNTVIFEDALPAVTCLFNTRVDGVFFYCRAVTNHGGRPNKMWFLLSDTGVIDQGVAGTEPASYVGAKKFCEVDFSVLDQWECQYFDK